MTKKTKAPAPRATAKINARPDGYVSPAKLRGMFGSNGTAMARAEIGAATAIKALGELLAPFKVERDGKVSLAREVKPCRDAWIAAYAKVRALDPASDGPRQAWSRYSRSAMAGAANLEGTQSRKPVKAKGSESKPVGTALPGEVIAANNAAPAPVEGEAPKIALNAAQSHALIVNQTRAAIAEVGTLIAGLDSKVKGRAELLAAFNRLADMGRDLEKSAVKVLG